MLQYFFFFACTIGKPQNRRKPEPDTIIVANSVETAGTYAEHSQYSPDISPVLLPQLRDSTIHYYYYLQSWS